MQAEIEIFERRRVDAAGVKFFENLCSQQEEIDSHGISDQFRDLENRPVVDLYPG